MEEILASIRKIISDDATPETPDGAADVVELTQMIQNDGSVVDVKANVLVEEPPMPASPPTPLPASAPLISEPASTAATAALSSLASTVEIERLATAPSHMTPIGNGARTLEDMVIELMRPLLKQWLDQNLPGTVDRLVQKEIERIARRAQD